MTSCVIHTYCDEKRGTAFAPTVLLEFLKHGVLIDVVAAGIQLVARLPLARYPKQVLSAVRLLDAASRPHNGIVERRWNGCFWEKRTAGLGPKRL